MIDIMEDHATPGLKKYEPFRVAYTRQNGKTKLLWDQLVDSWRGESISDAIKIKASSRVEELVDVDNFLERYEGDEDVPRSGTLIAIRRNVIVDMQSAQTLAELLVKYEFYRLAYEASAQENYSIQSEFAERCANSFRKVVTFKLLEEKMISLHEQQKLEQEVPWFFKEVEAARARGSWAKVGSM